MTAPGKGRLVVVSGPSGAGKSTVVAELVKDAKFARAVTATTRAPRSGERNGVDYEFLTEEAFEAGVRRGEFLEHARVYGNRYGTLKRNVEKVLAGGRNCVLVVDVQGVENLRRVPVDATYVFVEPPSMEVLEKRLRERGTDPEEALRIRLETARREMAAGDGFDLRVVNDVVKRAADQIRDFVLRRSPAEEPRRRSR